MKSLVAVFCLATIAAAMATSARSNDLDECAFNKTIGTCSATFSLNRENNTYTIPSVGSCRTVTVQIDGTQYPHKQFKQTIVDNVMVLEKGKPYSFAVSGCTSHPHKEDLFNQCYSSTPRCPKAQSGDEALACWSRFADVVNSCIGARAYGVKLVTKENGAWELHPEFYDF